MKKKAIPVYIFLALMVVICAAYFVTKSNLFRQQVNGNAQSIEPEAPVSSVAEEDLPDMYRYVSQGEPLPKPDVFAEGYTATVNDFRITINDVYVAKDTQGLPYPTHLSDSDGMEETVDENGTLTSAHSYLFMDITVENQSDLARTFNIAMSRPVFYAGEEELNIQASFELATQSINNDTDPQSHYTYMMEAGETVTYTRAYIFPDEKLEQVTDLFLPVTFGSSRLWNDKEEIWAWDPSAVMLDLTPLWPGGGEK